MKLLDIDSLSLLPFRSEMLTAACRSYYWSVPSLLLSFWQKSHDPSTECAHRYVYECLAHRASVSPSVSGVNILESGRDEGFSCVRWDLKHTWHRRTNTPEGLTGSWILILESCQLGHTGYLQECKCEIQITKPTKTPKPKYWVSKPDTSSSSAPQSFIVVQKKTI